MARGRKRWKQRLWIVPSECHQSHPLPAPRPRPRPRWAGWAARCKFLTSDSVSPVGVKHSGISDLELLPPKREGGEESVDDSKGHKVDTPGGNFTSGAIKQE